MSAPLANVNAKLLAFERGKKVRRIVAWRLRTQDKSETIRAHKPLTQPLASGKVEAP